MNHGYIYLKCVLLNHEGSAGNQEKPCSRDRTPNGRQTLTGSPVNGGNIEEMALTHTISGKQRKITLSFFLQAIFSLKFRSSPRQTSAKFFLPIFFRQRAEVSLSWNWMHLEALNGIPDILWKSSLALKQLSERSVKYWQFFYEYFLHNEYLAHPSET